MMKVIFGLSKIKKYTRPVVALGVFDGLHLAHRRILKDVTKIARRIKGTSMVVTFWPHPQKENNLYSLEHRLRLISRLGIKVCIIIRFNKRFSRIYAQDFVKDILVKKINAYYICVGKNFRFGRYAKGNFKTLNRLSSIYNFKLKVFDVMKIDHRSISSTYIRRLITKGKLGIAQRLMGGPVSVLGTVIKGVSLAKKLGFPTANINPHHEVLPASGVYAVKVIFNHKELNGICYIGGKPSLKTQNSILRLRSGLMVSEVEPSKLNPSTTPRIDGQRSRTIKTQSPRYIEVYIFNFKKDIYGQYLEIRFVKKIRDEKKFNSLAALAVQVKKDIILVKNRFPPQ